MHRAIPVGNKLLSKKWDEQNQAVHYEKLRTIRPQVDSATPATFTQQPAKAKKEQLLEDRYTEIERENRLLLEKMSNIMQSRASRTRSVKKRSLNKESRKREQIKISVENQALLRRLQERQPNYNTQKWEIERRRTERMLQNICQYPYQLGVTDEVVHRRFGSTDTRPDSLSQTLNLTASRRPKTKKLNPLHRDESGEVVYKRGVNVGNKYFLVEITMKVRMMVIKAYDIESPDSYVMQLDHDSAAELIGSDRKYEKIVDLLVFEKGELRLLDPRELPQSRAHNRITPVRPVRPPNSSNPRPRPRHIRQTSHGAAEPSSESWDLPKTQRKAATPQAAELERISEISVSPLANTAKIELQKAVETPQGPESLFDFEKADAVTMVRDDSAGQAERKIGDSGDEYVEDEQWEKPEEAKVEDEGTETAEMKQEPKAGVSEAPATQPLEESKERPTATPTHFVSAETGNQEPAPTVQEAFAPVPAPIDTRLEPATEIPAANADEIPDTQVDTHREEASVEKQETVPPLTEPRDIVSSDDPTGARIAPVAALLSESSDAGNLPSLTEGLKEATEAVEEVKAPSADVEPEDSETQRIASESADKEGAEKAQPEDFVEQNEQQPAETVAESAPKDDSEKPPPGEIPRYNGAVEGDEKVSGEPLQQSQSRDPPADSPSEPQVKAESLEPAAEGESITEEPQTLDKKEEGAAEEQKVEDAERKSDEAVEKSEEQVEEVEVIPANAAQRADTAPMESAEKTDTAPADAIEKRDIVPANAVEEVDLAPVESAEKTDAALADAIEKRDIVPADAVEKVDLAPVESAEKIDTALAGVIEKRDIVPADAVEEVDLAPVDSVEKTDAAPVEAGGETDSAAVDSAEKVDIAPVDEVEKTDAVPVDAVENADIAATEEPAAALEKTDVEPVKDEEYKAEEKPEVISPTAPEATELPEPPVPAEPQQQHSDSSIPEIKRSNVVDLPSPLQQPQELSEPGFDGSETHEENVTTVAAAAEMRESSESPELETVTIAQETAKNGDVGEGEQVEEDSREREESGKVSVTHLEAAEESEAEGREKVESVRPEDAEKSMPEPLPQAEALEDATPPAPAIESSEKGAESPAEETLLHPEVAANIPEPTEAIDAENPAEVVPQSHEADEEKPPATAEESSDLLPVGSAEPAEQAIPETSEPLEAHVPDPPQPAYQDTPAVPEEQEMKPPLDIDAIARSEQGGEVEEKPQGEQDNGEKAASSD